MMKRKPLSHPTVDQLEREINRLKTVQEIKKAVISAIGTLMVFAAMSVLISMLVLPVYKMQLGSMEPSLFEDDVVIFSSLGDIRRGDIIAFRYNNQVLVKRVIATGGEVVDMALDGKVTINNEPLEEPYITTLYTGEGSIGFPYLVPAENYFVMGDNRISSTDSRMAVIGAVNPNQIAGKAVIRVWPISRLGTVNRSEGTL